MLIVMANQKGGTGKSTVAVNLAVCSARDKKSTLLIDADPQKTSTYFKSIRQANDFEILNSQANTLYADVIPLLDQYDNIIVDSGGKDKETELFRTVLLTAAQGIMIVPIQPSQFDLWGAQDTFDIIQDARKHAQLRVYALLNRMQSYTNSREAKNDVKQFCEEYNLTLLNSILNNRVDYVNSLSRGLGVVEHNPDGKAADEMTAFYKEIKKLY